MPILAPAIFQPDTSPEPPIGEVEISSITPNSGYRGTSVDVEILGTGFSLNSVISFENGSGPVPSVSTTMFENETLWAVITIKDAGPRRGDLVWDLRVDSAVLQDAFFVKP